MYGYYSSMWIVLPAMLLAMYASYKVKATYQKYSKFNNRNGYTGAQVARMILERHGIHHIPVELTPGVMTDHYDSKAGVVRLSEGVYNSTSLAAIGIAAHEIGHVIQDDEAYAFLRIRHAIFPVIAFANQTAMPLAFLGIFLGALSSVNSIGYLILQFAILLFTAVVIFHVVTLPVELNASHRAIEILEGEQILDQEEIIPAKRVLRAAALTYIAAAAVAISNLLRFILLSRGRRR